MNCIAQNCNAQIELDCSAEENIPTSFKWQYEPTKFLLELYSKLNRCVGPFKQFRTKKLMWDHLAIQINLKFKINVSPTQVESRYKCIKRRTKKRIDYINKSGAVSIDSEFEEENINTVNNDDSLRPQLVLNEGRYESKRNMTENVVFTELDCSECPENFMSTELKGMCEQKNSPSIKWQSGPTKLLLELYGNLHRCVGPFKQFRTKKLMWDHLATQINLKFKINVSPIQVESRYKCIMRRTKKGIDNNNNSDEVRIDSEEDNTNAVNNNDLKFETEISNIVSNDDSLCPQYLLSEGRYESKGEMTENVVFTQLDCSECPENLMSSELDCSVEENNPTIFKWQSEPTKLLLELYGNLHRCVGQFKQFRTKKLMWTHIAIQINLKFKINVSPTQVETRYKCIMKRTKKDIDNNNKNGAVRINSEFEEVIINTGNNDDFEFEEEIFNDDSLCPQNIMSADRYESKSSLFRPSPSSSTSSTSILSTSSTPTPSTLRKQKKTSLEMLFEKFWKRKAIMLQEKMERKEKLHAEKEKNKQQRHAEKMKILKDILDSVKQNHQKNLVIET